MIFGVDVHPRYQAGFDVERAKAEGIEFMACKVSDGTSTTPFEGSIGWIRRGLACGLLCQGYHYLQPGNEDQQARVFASQLARAGGVPGMLDAEAITTSGAPSLTMAGIRLFLARAAAYGARIPLLYLPRWWWVRLGSPSLAGLPPLWASSYPSRRTGTPQQLYPAVSADRWAGYGGLAVQVLQFAETGVVAGRTPVDLDAYRGTREQLAALLGLTPPEDIVASLNDLRAVINAEVPRIVRAEAMDVSIPREGAGQAGQTTPRAIDAWTDSAWTKQRQAVEALTTQVTILVSAMTGVQSTLDAILAALSAKPDA